MANDKDKQGSNKKLPQGLVTDPRSIKVHENSSTSSFPPESRARTPDPRPKEPDTTSRASTAQNEQNNNINKGDVNAGGGVKGPKKPEVVPPSGLSEPSEPSDVKPKDKPKDQISRPQEENPQVIAHKPGKQANNGKGNIKSRL